MIYFTDTDPVTASSNLCDRHLRKTIAFSLKVIREALENRTQQADPYVRWACASRRNLKWVIEHAHSAIHEVYFRHRKGMPAENTYAVVDAEKAIRSQIEGSYLTPFPNNVAMVREYYRTNVAPKSRWTRRFPPDWVLEY